MRERKRERGDLCDRKSLCKRERERERGRTIGTEREKDCRRKGVGI